MAAWAVGDTVVVLGAGATRGAKWVSGGGDGVGELAPMCVPPLNADFFTQLQRITAKRHQPTVQAVIDDALELYGSDFSLTLEEYFTQLEAMIATLEAGSSTSSAFKVSQLQTKRTNLLDGLSAVLEESADVAKKKSVGHKSPCTYHAELVSALNPKDTVVSFNYDCVIDHALRTTGTEKWSARHGYGFPKPSRVVGYQPWNAEKAPDAQNRSINLLKLHGSLNWFPFPTDGRNGEIRLREKPYKQNGQKRYEIVPPEYVKTVGSRPIYGQLWSRGGIGDQEGGRSSVYRLLVYTHRSQR